MLKCQISADKIVYSVGGIDLKKEKISLAVYTLSHAAVDFACAYLIIGITRDLADAALLMLVYNFFAFAVQMPLGIVFDAANRNAVGAALGCIVTASAYFFSGIPMAAAVICGIGNAAFHLGGGIDVLNYSEKSSYSGVFVSSGAIGLFFGAMCAKSGINISLAVISVLAVLGVVIVLARKKLFGTMVSENAEFSVPGKNAAVYGAAALLFLVVLLRSLTGFGMSFPWKIGAGAVIAAFCAAGGKCLGGFASDSFGAEKASAASLCAAALLFIFADNIICGAVGILLFNMTMPVTLRRAADLFKGCKGFSFGLMTFGLFCGFIPCFAEKSGFVLAYGVLAALSVVSAALLVIALRISDGREKLRK